MRKIHRNREYFRTETRERKDGTQETVVLGVKAPYVHTTAMRDAFEALEVPRGRWPKVVKQVARSLRRKVGMSNRPGWWVFRGAEGGQP